MPTVPTLEAPQVEEQALPGRPYPRLDANVPESAGGEGAAQGLTQLGGAEFEQEHKLKTQQDQLRTLDAATQLRAGSTALQYGQNGQGGVFSLHGMDAMDLPNKVLPQYDAMASKISSTLTPDQQRMFQAHVLEGRSELHTNLERHEFSEGNVLQDEILKNSAQRTMASAAASWRDPTMLARSQSDLKGIVEMEGDRKGWTPDIRDTHYKDLVGALHQNVIVSMIGSGDLDAARTYLFQNFGAMDPKESEAAHRLIHTEQQQETEQAEKAREKQADAVMKQGLTLQQGGGLSAAWVFQHQDSLKAHELKFMLDQASGKGAETNPMVYAPLLTRMSKGEDVRDEANAALARHDLSLSDYTKLVEGAGKDRPNSVKAGSTYIEQALQTDLLNPDPAKATSKANALSDFEAWTNDNPKATADQSMREAKSLAGRYLIINPEQSILTLPVPHYLSGSRVAPNMDKTEAATMTAFQNGEISAQELERQARLAKQWRTAIAAQPKPTSEPK